MASESLFRPPQASAARAMTSSIPTNVHGMCSCVNALLPIARHASGVSDEEEKVHESWRRIEPRLRELSGHRDGKGIVVWLSRKLHYDTQRVHNWISRGVPSKEQAQIAAAIKWTVAQVAGVKDPPERWPFETIDVERWRRLTERQKAMVELVVDAEIRRIESASGNRTGTEE